MQNFYVNTRKNADGSSDDHIYALVSNVSNGMARFQPIDSPTIETLTLSFRDMDTVDDDTEAELLMKYGRMVGENDRFPEDKVGIIFATVEHGPCDLTSHNKSEPPTIIAYGNSLLSLETCAATFGDLRRLPEKVLKGIHGQADEVTNNLTIVKQMRDGLKKLEAVRAEAARRLEAERKEKEANLPVTVEEWADSLRGVHEYTKDKETGKSMKVFPEIKKGIVISACGPEEEKNRLVLFIVGLKLKPYGYGGLCEKRAFCRIVIRKEDGTLEITQNQVRVRVVDVVGKGKQERNFNLASLVPLRVENLILKLPEVKELLSEINK